MHRIFKNKTGYELSSVKHGKVGIPFSFGCELKKESGIYMVLKISRSNKKNFIKIFNFYIYDLFSSYVNRKNKSTFRGTFL